MATTEQALSEFIDAWNAARRPSVHDYLERVDAGERDELAGLIEAFLEWAPAPAYSEQQREEIASEPAVRATLGLVDEPSLWPALLPKLRRRARVTRQQVVRQLAGMLGVTNREDRVAVYYHRMEIGTLDPGGVSQRVLDALGRIFGVSPEEIERAGDYSPSAPAAAALYYRAEEPAAPGSPGDEAPVLADSRPPDRELDEVDRLFKGGR